MQPLQTPEIHTMDHLPHVIPPSDSLTTTPLGPAQAPTPPPPLPPPPPILHLVQDQHHEHVQDQNDSPAKTHDAAADETAPSPSKPSSSPAPTPAGRSSTRSAAGRGTGRGGSRSSRPPARPKPLAPSVQGAPALTNVLQAAKQRTLDFSHHTGVSTGGGAIALPPLQGYGASSAGVTPLWLTLSKSKQDLQAWACLSLVPNANPELIDQSHLDSIYRQDPELHRICPLRHVSTQPNAGPARPPDTQPQTPHRLSITLDHDGNESDPIEDPDAPPLTSAQAAAAGIVDFGPPKLLPPGAAAPTSPRPLPPPSTPAAAAAYNGRGPTPTCTARTCKENPNCLNYVGIAAWLDPKTRTKYISDHLAAHSASFPARLFHTFTSASATTHSILRSPATTPTLGLTNLGATCYANALLQCWFADPQFRSRVYTHASTDPAMHALALVFAAMQRSRQPWLAPRAFLEYLQVERGVQQDAQEFGKLVMQLLDDRCKAFQSTGLVGGKGEYVTTCTACGTETRSPHTFHEVLVHPSVGGEGVQELVDRAVGADELLDGDNAVQCQVCVAKKPASRRLELQAVARSICVQVLRFTYDARTQSRKKNATSIKIQKRLELVGEMWALTAIVVHKGRAAHAGHYVAVVRQAGGDQGEEKWTLVDDEKVTTLGARDSWTKDPINSTEAYLLYYTRESELQQEAGTAQVEVPAALMEEVEALDAEWVGKANEISQLHASIESEFDAQLAHRLHLYQSLHLPTLSTPCAYLPNRLLDLVFSPTSNLPLDLGDPHFDPYRLVTCPHGHLDPREMHYVRRVSIAGAREFMEFVREFAPDNPALARDPPTSAVDGGAKCKECVADVLTHHERVAFRKDGWDAWQHVSPPTSRPLAGPGSPSSASASSSSAATGGSSTYWVPADWIAECLDLHELVPPRPEHVDSLRCAHHQLTPNAAARVQVSDEHVEVLRAFCPEYTPARTDELVECGTCRAQLERDARDAQERMDAAFTEAEQLCEVMPGDWSVLGVDNPIDMEVAKAREYVRTCIEYVGGDEATVAPAAADVVRGAREHERKVWHQFRGWIPSAHLPDRFVVLPANFIASWWRFTMDPAAAVRPRVVRFMDLLCTEHRLLKFDPRDPLDRSLLKFAIVPRDMWDERIGVFYPSDGGAGGEVVGDETPVCKECRERELTARNDKGEAKYELLVTVRKRGSGGSDAAGKTGRGAPRKSNGATASHFLLPPPPPLLGIAPTASTPAPRTTRNSANKPTPESLVYVAPTETVQDIKKEIAQFADRIPMDQQLFLMPMGVELADRDARVLDSGLYHGCMLELEVAPLMVHDSDEEEEFAAGGGGARKRARDSGGFGGLLSGSGGGDSRSSAAASASSSTNEVVVLSDMDEDPQPAPAPTTPSAGALNPGTKRRSVSVIEGDQGDDWTNKRRRRHTTPHAGHADDLDMYVDSQVDGSNDDNDIVMKDHHAQMREDEELAWALNMSMQDHAEQAPPLPQPQLRQYGRHPGGAMALHLGATGDDGGVISDAVWDFTGAVERLPVLPPQVSRDPTMAFGGDQVRKCSRCTFDNPPGTTCCEMCRQEL